MDIDKEIDALIKQVESVEYAKSRLREIAYEIDDTTNWTMGGHSYWNKRRYDRIVIVVGELYKAGGTRKYPRQQEKPMQTNTPDTTGAGQRTRLDALLDKLLDGDTINLNEWDMIRALAVACRDAQGELQDAISRLWEEWSGEYSYLPDILTALAPLLEVHHE